MREELLSPTPIPSEVAEETTLRPRRLDEFVGQPRLREHLEIMLTAAKQRGQAVDHVLLAGPPGLGKTTLAGIIAAEMGARMQPTSGPALERAGDLAAILTNLDDGDVLFIDEIHRLPRVVEEVLYPAMEDFQLDIVIGKGPSRAVDPARPAALHARRRDDAHRPDHRSAARPLRVRRPSRLLRRRRARRDPRRAAHDPRRASSTPTARARSRVARRGTPRIANRLLKRVRDYAEVRADGTGHAATARTTRSRCSRSTSSASTRSTGRSSARCAARSRAGRSASGTLAVAVGEAPETVEDVYEPFLLQCGLLERTPRGRMATPSAFAHLGLHDPRRRARLRTCSESSRCSCRYRGDRCRRTRSVRGARSHRARHDRERQGQHAVARRHRRARRRADPRRGCRRRAGRCAVASPATPGMFSGGFDLKVMRSRPGAAGQLVTDGGALITRMFGSRDPGRHRVLRPRGRGRRAPAARRRRARRRAGAFRIGLIETQIGMVLPRWAVELVRGAALAAPAPDSRPSAPRCTTPTVRSRPASSTTSSTPTRSTRAALGGATVGRAAAGRVPRARCG